MRAYGINPPKDTKAGNDQLYQTVLDLFNAVYNGLFVRDRAIFSGCPGRQKHPLQKSAGTSEKTAVILPYFQNWLVLSYIIF